MTSTDTATRSRRRRLDGEMSRARILNAAREIASERGYDGTSIGAVSAKCGLPASSIYWHFKDKDDLFAAVIESSFSTWLQAWEFPADGSIEQRGLTVATQIAEGLMKSPDFIRLGLMLALERRPEEPRARAMYISVRAQAGDALASGFSELMPELTSAQISQLSTYALAGADGLFVAKEINGDSIDLLALFKLHARALIATATAMAAGSNA